MQNQCRVAPILVRQGPLSDLFFGPIPGPNPGLKQLDLVQGRPLTEPLRHGGACERDRNARHGWRDSRSRDNLAFSVPSVSLRLRERPLGLSTHSRIDDADTRKGTEMAPECAHSMQNRCRSKPVLVHERPQTAPITSSLMELVDSTSIGQPACPSNRRRRRHDRMAAIRHERGFGSARNAQERSSMVHCRCNSSRPRRLRHNSPRKEWLAQLNGNERIAGADVGKIRS